MRQEVEMGCVIDANIIKGIFQEDVAGSHSLSASPMRMLEIVVRSGTRICLDDRGLLEHEWDAAVDSDWYSNWFVTLASQANLARLGLADCRQTISHLRTSCGFPRSRDHTYVSLSVKSAEQEGKSNLITEDMDFFEPAAKGQSKVREKFLDGRLKGSVQKYLRKKHEVYVQSVFLYLEELNP